MTLKLASILHAPCSMLTYIRVTITYQQHHCICHKTSHSKNNYFERIFEHAHWIQKVFIRRYKRITAGYMGELGKETFVMMLYSILYTSAEVIKSY